MKKVTRIATLSTLLFAILVTSCALLFVILPECQSYSAPPGYQVIEENGDYFLTFDYVRNNKYDIDPTPDKEYENFPDIYFDSVKDMKKKYMNGSFTEDELIRLYHFFDRDNKNRIVIPDLDNLYNVSLPRSIRINGVQNDKWGNYVIELVGRNNDRITGDAAIYRDAEGAGAKAILEEINTWESGNENRAGYDAEPYDSSSSKMRKYTISKGNEVMYVIESCTPNESTASEEYRYSFRMAWDGVYCLVFLKGLDARLSYKDVSSFGLVPLGG